MYKCNTFVDYVHTLVVCTLIVDSKTSTRAKQHSKQICNKYKAADVRRSYLGAFIYPRQPKSLEEKQLVVVRQGYPSSVFKLRKQKREGNTASMTSFTPITVTSLIGQGVQK